MMLLIYRNILIVGEFMKIVDLQLNIDGLKLKDGETVDDVISRIKGIVDTNYDIQYDILYEE